MSIWYYRIDTIQNLGWVPPFISKGVPRVSKLFISLVLYTIIVVLPSTTYISPFLSTF